MGKQKDAPESKGKFQDALDKLNKQYGMGTILTLNSKSTGDYDVISTGSIGFDWITLGVGGFVKGKLYELMGWEGTSKSTVCIHAAAECQKKGGVVLYIDGEHAMDMNYMRAIGVDTSKLLIAQPSCGEEGFNIAMDMINTGTVDLVIIDSDSSLIPRKVLEGEVGDSAIGKKAMLNSNVYPKMKSALAINKTCVIVVSQYREKIGVMFGNPTTTQGGHALKFYTDCRLEISRSLAKDGDITFGTLIKVKATKNKMCPPYRTSRFNVVFGQGIDKEEEILDLLAEFSLGRRYGKSFYIGEKKYDTEELKLLLKQDIGMVEELKGKIIEEIRNKEVEGNLLPDMKESITEQE